jgi:hypothetical protein
MWFCSLCEKPKNLVFGAKFTHPTGRMDVGDMCLSCLKIIAELDLSMEKADMIGYGYTEEVLKHMHERGSMKLMQCVGCHKWRAEVLLTNEGYCCASCFQYFTYVAGGLNH